MYLDITTENFATLSGLTMLPTYSTAIIISTDICAGCFHVLYTGQHRRLGTGYSPWLHWFWPTLYKVGALDVSCLKFTIIVIECHWSTITGTQLSTLAIDQRIADDWWPHDGYTRWWNMVLPPRHQRLKSQGCWHGWYIVRSAPATPMTWVNL